MNQLLINSRRILYFRIFLVFLLIIIFASLPLFLLPKKANAQLGSCGAAIGASLFGGAASSLVSGAVSLVLPEVPVRDSQVRKSTASLEVKEGWLDACQRAFLKTILESLLNDITLWVKGGFNGGPMFAQDLKKSLEYFADGEAAAFFGELTGLQGNLCDPDYLSLLVNLQTKKSMKDRYECTLTIAKENLNAFYDDFSKGGWLAYEQSLADQNNAGGFIIKGSADVGNRIANKETNILAELSWSKGFFGQTDANGKTITPGVVIQERLGKSLNSDITQLELADEFDELLGAVLNQAGKRIFSGAQGLFD